MDLNDEIRRLAYELYEKSGKEVMSSPCRIKNVYDSPQMQESLFK